MNRLRLIKKMKIKFDKLAFQEKIRIEAAVYLDNYAEEELCNYSAFSGEELWIYRYHYRMIIESSEKILCYGLMMAKAKKKYCKISKKTEHYFAFQANVFSKYDIKMKFEHINQDTFNKLQRLTIPQI